MKKTQTIKQRKALGTGSRKSASRSPASRPSADSFKDLDKRATVDAAVALDRAFTWSESREGHKYWDAVHLRLCQIGGADQMDGFHFSRPGPREMEWEDVDHFHETNSVEPASWECQKCCAPIGWLGRAIQWARIPLHRCKS